MLVNLRHSLNEGVADKIYKEIYREMIVPVRDAFKYFIKYGKFPNSPTIVASTIKAKDADHPIDVRIFFRTSDNFKGKFEKEKFAFSGVHKSAILSTGLSSRFKTTGHEIHINIVLNEKVPITNYDLSNFQSEFANTLRHEVEHYHQYGLSKHQSDFYKVNLHRKLQQLYSRTVRVTSGKYTGQYGKIVKVNDTKVTIKLISNLKLVTLSKKHLSSQQSYYKYLTSLLEVPAHVTGLMTQAKYLRQPLGTVIYDYLDTKFSESNLTDGEKKLVYRVFMEYATERYPNVKTHL